MRGGGSTTHIDVQMNATTIKAKQCRRAAQRPVGPIHGPRGELPNEHAMTTGRTTGPWVVPPRKDCLGRLEPAATIAGFAFDPTTASPVPQLSTVIAHLRDVLGEATYESLACKGETMTTAEMVTYAYDQIDQARTELNVVSYKTCCCSWNVQRPIF